SSFQRSTWCSKKTESPPPRLISATGTTSPSTWQVDLPNWISVMSLIRGASRHPESLTRSLMSRGAPQERQERAVGSFWVWPHWQTRRCSGWADGSVILRFPPGPGYEVAVATSLSYEDMLPRTLGGDAMTATVLPQTPEERTNQRNSVLAGFLGWTLDAFDF